MQQFWGEKNDMVKTLCTFAGFCNGDWKHLMMAAFKSWGDTPWPQGAPCCQQGAHPDGFKETPESDFVFRNQLHVSSHAEYWQFTQIPSTAEGRWYLSFAFKHAIKVFSHYLLSLPLLMLSQSNKGLCQPPAVTCLFHTGCWGRGNEELK